MVSQTGEKSHVNVLKGKVSETGEESHMHVVEAKVRLGKKAHKCREGK
jgi:hypothetical protein